MIKLTRKANFDLTNEDFDAVYWIKPDAIVLIEQTSTNPDDATTDVQIVNGRGFCVDETPEQILALMDVKPSAPLDDLHMVLVTEAQRVETSNSGSPMWRCKTDDDSIRFNIFQHTDPDKNNYALFAAAGWSDLLDRIPLKAADLVAEQAAF